MSQAALDLSAPPEGPDEDGWRVVELGGTRIRWRHDGKEHAHFAAGYALQVHRPETAKEWWDVKSWHARDWFALGVAAAGSAP